MTTKDRVLEVLMDRAKCTLTEAERVYDAYRFHKILLIDQHTGSWSLNHGVFLEPDVIQNAIKQTATQGH